MLFPSLLKRMNLFARTLKELGTEWIILALGVS